tara:strand:+ start:848 stop:1561 length:714 start_codon:yes stop_codon:yes gene_type:complete
MIHLAGMNPVNQALEEIKIYETLGIDGVIIENYHGELRDVKDTLNRLEFRSSSLEVGVNILPNEWSDAFVLAHEHNASFIQVDYVAGSYYAKKIVNSFLFDRMRNDYPRITVLGGVWPKYHEPVSGSNLNKDIYEGMKLVDAIVVTGEETGKETPIRKIKEFRRIIGNEYPLIIGDGLNFDNAFEQLMICDGAIVGSAFKPNNNREEPNTKEPVDASLVKRFMEIVYHVREEKILMM